MKQVNWNDKVFGALMQDVNYVIDAINSRDKGLPNNIRDAWRNVLNIKDNAKRNDSVRKFADVVVSNTEKNANARNVYLTNQDKAAAQRYVYGKLSCLAYGEKRDQQIRLDRCDAKTKIKGMVWDAIGERDFRGEFDVLKMSMAVEGKNGYGDLYRKASSYKGYLSQPTQHKIAMIDGLAKEIVSETFKVVRSKKILKGVPELRLMEEIQEFTENEIQKQFLTRDEKHEIAGAKGKFEQRKLELQAAKREKELAEKAKRIHDADPRVKYADEIRKEVDRLAIIERDIERDFQTQKAARAFVERHKDEFVRIRKPQTTAKGVVLLENGKDAILAQQDAKEYYLKLFINEVEKARTKIVADREAAKPQLALVLAQEKYEEDNLDNDIDQLTALVVKEAANADTEEKKNAIIKYGVDKAAELYGDRPENLKDFEQYLQDETVRFINGYRVEKLDEETVYVTPIENTAIQPQGNDAGLVEVNPVVKNEEPVTPAKPEKVAKKHSGWKKGLAIGGAAAVLAAGVLATVGLITPYENDARKLGEEDGKSVQISATVKEGTYDLNKFTISGVKNVNEVVSKNLNTKVGFLRSKVGLKPVEDVYADAYVSSLGAQVGEEAAHRAVVADLAKTTENKTLSVGDYQKVKVAYVSAKGTDFNNSDGLVDYLKNTGKFSDAQADDFVAAYESAFRYNYALSYNSDNYKTLGPGSGSQGTQDKELDFGEVFTEAVGGEDFQSGKVIGNNVYFLTGDKLYKYTLTGDVSASGMSSEDLVAKLASAQEPVVSNVCSDSFITSWTNKDSSGKSLVSESKMEEFQKKAAQKVGATGKGEKVVVTERHKNTSLGSNQGTTETLTYVGLDADGEIKAVEESGEMTFYVEENKNINYNATAAAAFVNDNGGRLTSFYWDGIQYGYENVPTPPVVVAPKSKERA